MKRHFGKETPAMFIYAVSGAIALSGFLAWTAWNSSSPWILVSCAVPAVVVAWIALRLLQKSVSWKELILDGSRLIVVRRLAVDFVFELPRDLSSVVGRAKAHQLVIALNNGTQRWRLVLAGLEERDAFLHALDGLIPVMRQKPDGSRLVCRFSEIDTAAGDRFLIGRSQKPKGE
jgi:hypothetical protein